jgi:DNA-binding transcriptional LysR family regulator
MDVNTRRLRYFLAVADCGHFGRAAAALHVSPTALSEQVRKLEDELGVRLLDRNPRGAQLTPVGVEVADRARAVLRETSALTNVVTCHLRQRVRALRLGFVTMAAGELTPHLVAAFEQRMPGARVDMVHLDYAHQVEAVLTDEVDAAIVRGPIEPERLRTLEIAREPRMVMMSAAHPLADSTALCCADVACEVRVTTENVPEAWRRWWSLDPGPDGTPPPYGPVVHSFDEQLELAAAGVAISIVPATAAHVFRRADIAFVPLEDAAPTAILLVARHNATAPQIEALFAAATVVSGLRLSRT